MGYLDAFELVGEKERPFITVRERSITFSKTAIECLNFTPYVHMFIDRVGKRVAFQESGDDENAVSFYKDPKQGRPVLVRISDVKKVRMLLELAGTEATEKGYRFYGEFVPDEKLIGFDLSNPVVEAQHITKITD